MKTKNTSLRADIDRIAKRVHNRFAGEGSGHDWWHIERVRKMALRIAKSEGANSVVVELGALLHDMADHKLHGGDVEAGMALVASWLNEIEIDQNAKNEVLDIVSHVSYLGAGVPDRPLSLAGLVVRDADRLDAIGAIGIARTFAYGGNKNRLMYDPAVNPVAHQSFDAYKSSTAPTINHFYEKLLLLKDRMHTKTARKIAESRHIFMEQYLAQFFAEWQADDSAE